MMSIVLTPVLRTSRQILCQASVSRQLLKSASCLGQRSIGTSTTDSSARALKGENIAERYEKKLKVSSHFNAVIKDQGDQTKATVATKNEENYHLPHPIWSPTETNNVLITHRPPEDVTDYMAYYTVMTLRKSFDFFSGYTLKKKMNTLDENTAIYRCIFLETVAGVPGFSAAMIRHLHSLRRMQRDHGWIHTLLEEAENERMHLLTFLQLKKPGLFFRGSVIITQWLFTGLFSLAYLISPKFCHRFVGYLEEQAVVTYTSIIEDLDAGKFVLWSHLPAPIVAKDYWRLPDGALMRDVLLAIRADEAHHRLVNHTLGSMKPDDTNPFKPGH